MAYLVVIEGLQGLIRRRDGLYRELHCKLKGPCFPPRCVCRTELNPTAQLS